MSKYYGAALIPAVVAVVCVVAAWYIMRQPALMDAASEILPPYFAPAAIPPSRPPRPRGTVTTTPSLDVLPSDRLRVPRPPARDVIATCVDVGAGLQKGQRIWKLNFSSECRDVSAWPTPAAWRQDLATHLRNVSSVALRSAAVHPSEYTVDVWNNFVDISVGGTSYAVSVPIGDYATGVALAAAVQAAIIATAGALAAFTVAFDALTDAITVSEGTPTAFTLMWRSGATANVGMWKTMGFELADAASVLVGGSHDAVAPGRVDLVGALALDVFCDELKHSVDGPIGRILLQRTVAGAPVFQSFTEIDDSHAFWPVGRLTFVTLRFMVERVRVNQDGSLLCVYRPYVFNGRNNTLRLDFGCTEYVNPMELDVLIDPGTA